MSKTATFLRTCLGAGGFILSTLAFGGCASGSNQQQTENSEDPDGFTEIFDGVSLAGWRGDSAIWRVEEGTLVGEIVPGKELEKNSFIIWEGGRPADFEFVAEYRLTGPGNSGVNYRSEAVPDVPFALRGYQADIDAANTYTGQNYEERGRTILAFPGQKVRLPPVDGEIKDHAQRNVWTAAEQLDSLGNRDSLRTLIKPEDWNEIRIVAKGNRLQHYINGTLMSDVTDDDEKNRKLDGFLGVQVHVGPPMKIAFKNIRLKDL